jgi:ATP-binding cassette subfamily C protein/ATP-binding cassette subfamily C protein EexD
MKTAQNTPLNRAFKACRRPIVAIGVMSIFVNLAMLAVPLYSIQISDRVITSRNADTLVMLSLIALLFLLLYGALEYVRSVLQHRVSVLFDDRLRTYLFDRLLRAETAGVPVSGVQILNDAETVRKGIASGLIGTLCDVPWIPIFVTLCFLLHLFLGCVALAGAIIIFLLALLTEMITKSGMREAGRLSLEASTFAASALKNGDAVRGLGMGETVRDHWGMTQAAAVATMASASERGSAIMAMTKFVRMLVQAGMMGMGAWLAIDQEISPGVMIASSILMVRAFSPVEQLVGQWSRLLALRSAHGRLKQLFQALPDQAEPISLPPPVGKIDVENIVVLPPSGGRPVVKGVSFQINPGDVLAVVGASGSGKSSLARAIAGVWPVTQGTVRIDGADYTQWGTNQLGAHIGYLPQSVELFAGTIKQNIARLTSAEDSAVIAAAKAAGAHEIILRLPKGYDTQIGDAGAALSGGTRQRIGLARALFGNPSLIVLDEPNANLDEEGERALAQALAAMKAANRAVLIISHRPHILAHVDKILVLSFGLTLAFGPRDLVIANMRGQRVAVASNNDKPVLRATETA